MTMTATLSPSQNAVHCIVPYRHPQAPEVWVFDDERHGLDQEPFVGAANAALDSIESELGAHGKLVVMFSERPMPAPLRVLRAMSKTGAARTHGCSYHDGERELWLCPALMHYFAGDTAPETIYLTAQAGDTRQPAGACSRSA